MIEYVSRMVFLDQGSVLGPLLFLIYVNDLLMSELKGSIYSFADNTALVYSARTRDGLVWLINEDMKLISSWFYQHRMYPNLAKTKVITFGYKDPVDIRDRIWLHQSPSCAGDCGCKPLSQVHEIKYLGVMLDNKLTWSVQSQYLQSCLRKLNYVLFYASRQFSKFHLRKIYVALFESRLRYGIVNWGTASEYLLKPLIVLQKRAIRSIAGLRAGTSTGAVFKSLKLLNLDQI